jgi:hypothetical protein
VGRKAATVLRRALELHIHGSAGLRSWDEFRLLRLLRESGLPEPLVNARIPVAGGDPIEPDYLWPRARLVVELDGCGHARPWTQRTDERRDQRFKAAGFRVIRCTNTTLHRTIGMIRRHLASQTAAGGATVGSEGA